MNKRPITQTRLAIMNVLIDCFFLGLGVWFFDYYFRLSYIDSFLLTVYGMIGLVYLFVAYRVIHPVMPKFWVRFLRHIMAVLLSGLVVSGLLSLLLFSMYGTDLVLLIIALASIVLSTIVFEFVNMLLKRSADNRLHVLFVGVSRQSEAIINLFTKENGFQIVGVLDNVAKKDEQVGEAFVIGKINTIEDVLQSKRVDLIVQTGATEHTVTVMTLAEHKRIRFLILPELLGIMGRSIDTVPIEHRLLLEPRGTVLSGWSQVGKRFFDFILSLALLIVLSPIFVLIGLIIALTTLSLSVFVGQKRVDGRSGREFVMWRFRTLQKGTKEDQPTDKNFKEFPGSIATSWNNPKATGFGRFLRKTHLMDLPQLWNVFIGDMGVVGPRPPFNVEYEAYDWLDRKRLLIKPGLTGMWQLKRQEYTFDEMVRLDRWYIENWSFGLDIKLLFLTLGKFISGRI